MKIKLFIILMVSIMILNGCSVDSVILDSNKMINHDLNKAGEYGVGYKKLFVTDDTQLFNEWGEKYGDDEHKELFETLNAFEPHTVVTQMWYPAVKISDPSKDCLGHIPMTSGTIVYMKDLYLPYESIQKDIAKNGIGNLKRSDGKDIRTLSRELSKDDFDEVLSGLVDELLNRELDSRKNAPIADGKFPVVVMAHGLGGTGYMWNEAAEALASQGYIVVAPTFISDGTMPEVFSNPASIVGQKTDDEIIEYYNKLSGQGNVVENFFKYLYGTELNMAEAEANGNFDALMNQIKASKASEEGGIIATEMMGDLFDQRVKDVSAILNELKIMNETGEFAGKIDLSNVGMTGHSLGSITTMVALERLELVKVGIGVNNGVPVKWEPDDLEATEIEKPLFLLHGQEDDFLNLIFKNVWQEMYIPQGGDINKTYVLEEERALATEDNPDPILTATYNRALGPKIAVEVANSDHGNLVEDNYAFYPSEGDQTWKMVTEKQRMLSNGLFGTGLLAKKFDLIASKKLDDGYVFNQAAYIRDYYYKAWFGYYLKGQNEYKEYILKTPFEEGIKVKSSDM